MTPFFPNSSLVPELNDLQVPPNNEDKIEKATFKNKSKASAWHHTPQLHKNENGEYCNGRNGRNVRLCYGSRKKKDIDNVRQFPPCSPRNTSKQTLSNNNRTLQNTRVPNIAENLNNLINDNSRIVDSSNSMDSIVNNDNNNISNSNITTVTNSNSNNNKNSNNRINNNNNNNNNNNTSSQPRVIRVQPRDDSNICSTKVKATLSIELETSHTFGVTSSSCYDGYDEGMTRVDFK